MVSCSLQLKKVIFLEISVAFSLLVPLILFLIFKFKVDEMIEENEGNVSDNLYSIRIWTIVLIVVDCILVLVTAVLALSKAQRALLFLAVLLLPSLVFWCFGIACFTSGEDRATDTIENIWNNFDSQMRENMENYFHCVDDFDSSKEEDGKDSIPVNDKGKTKKCSHLIEDFYSSSEVVIVYMIPPICCVTNLAAICLCIYWSFIQRTRSRTRYHGIAPDDTPVFSSQPQKKKKSKDKPKEKQETIESDMSQNGAQRFYIDDMPQYSNVHKSENPYDTIPGFDVL